MILRAMSSLTSFTVSDYGDTNPLYYDYYGFPSDLYRLSFKSRGDSAISHRIVELFKDVSCASVSIRVLN
jgi:aromatic ring-opening dioxygenase catalytic subunit (LigB family)